MGSLWNIMEKRFGKDLLFNKCNLKKYMKKLMLSSIIVFSFIFLFSNCNEPEIEINTLDEFETYLEEEVEALHIPALSVLVFKEDNILYENYLGFL